MTEADLGYRKINLATTHTKKCASWSGTGGKRNMEEIVQVTSESLYKTGTMGVNEVKGFLR